MSDIDNEIELEKWKAKDKAITKNARLLHNLVKKFVRDASLDGNSDLYRDMVDALAKIKLESEM